MRPTALLSFPKEGVLRIFFTLKIRRLRPGVNPANLGTKAAHLAILLLKILPALIGPFCCSCLNIVVENLLLHIISNVYCLFNPLNAELNPICHLLALLGAHHILHISRIRVIYFCRLYCFELPLKLTILRWFMPVVFEV